MSAQVDQVRLAGPRPRLTPEGGVDPISAEVTRNVLETVCFEMAAYVSRTATTPILNQSNERNATILDGRGRLAALSVGIPQFMLTSTLPVRFALEFLGARGVPARRRVRGQRPVPRRRPPARLQRLRPGVLAPRFGRHGSAGADRVDPMPPRRHRRRRARWLQRHRQRHLGRGRALARAQGDRPRRRAPRRALRPPGQQQPHPRLHRRPRGPRSGRPSWRSSRLDDLAGAGRCADGRGRRRLDDRLRRAALPRRGAGAGPTVATRPTAGSTTTRSATPTSTSTWRSPSTATG